MRTAKLNFQPGTDLASHIRSIGSFPDIERVHVSVPIRSVIDPKHLALQTREAEEELRERDGVELRIWVDNYFMAPGPTVIS